MKDRGPGRLAWLLLLALVGCSKPSTPRQDSPAPALSSAAPPLPEAPPLARDGLPHHDLERFAPGTSHPDGIHPIPGALIVTDGTRISRLVDGQLEFLGELPGIPSPHRNHVSAVVGQWPDRIELLYESHSGYEHAYFPLRGGGKGLFFETGHSPSTLRTLGASSFTSIFDLGGADDRVQTLRGPAVPHRLQGYRQAGCRPDEVGAPYATSVPRALRPLDLQFTSSGVLVAVGLHCERSGLGAEVWDRSGRTSRVVRLDGLIPRDGGGETRILAGTSDDLWILSNGVVIRFKDGTFEPVAKLEEPVNAIYLLPTGQLAALTGDSLLQRLDLDGWKPIGRLNWPIFGVKSIVVDQGVTWFSGSRVYQLRDAPSIEPYPTCKTPLVLVKTLSIVLDEDSTTSTFPTLRRALASFPAREELTLVEFSATARRRLGLVVRNQSQGEAVIEHIKQTMPAEQPRLLCLAPHPDRVIDLRPP